MKIIGGDYLNEVELRQRGLRSVGENVSVHETAILVDLDRIEIGSHVRIDGFTVLSAAGGFLKIGNHVHIASHADIYAGMGVEMQDFVGLSQGGRIYSTNDDYTGGSLTGPTVAADYRKSVGGKVTLERHVVVGSGSVVFPGVTIGEGATVGALSLVNRTLEPWGVYAGIPARFLRERRRDLLDCEKALLEAESATSKTDGHASSATTQ
jgi:acetyltransferase-like isoleucine patch superfamily enzyme